MKEVYPDFYKDFKCTADKCRHSCCMGWEIDIDSDAMERFSLVGGDFGKRLRENIAGGEEPHFVLGENERCPFLNNRGLCDIILELGEDAICQICTDHPRFRTFLSDRTETGLGLCCEEAGRLLFCRREPITFSSSGTESLAGGEAALINLREKIFEALQDRSMAVAKRIDKVLELAGSDRDGRELEAWAELFLGLERMDETWTIMLENLRDNARAIDFADFDAYMAGRQYEYENLLVYFIYRHFMTALEDENVTSKVRFAALGYEMLHALGALKWRQTGSFTVEDQIEYARLFSSETEYSQENMDALFDVLM